MATFNVKNLPDALHRRLQKRARERRRSLAKEVTCILEEAVDRAEPVSILDLPVQGAHRSGRVRARAPKAMRSEVESAAVSAARRYSSAASADRPRPSRSAPRSAQPSR